jgi:AraC-like DNA-binding protein
MDALNEILRSTRLAGGVFLDAEFSAPWCVFSGVTPEETGASVPGCANIIAYHYVCEGGMLLQLEGHEDVAVECGDVVLLPHNEPHRLASGPGLVPVNAEDFIEHGEGGALARVVHGGGGTTTRMLCGFLASEVPNDPIIRVLPRVLKVRIADAPSSAWIESTMRFGAREIAGGAAHSPALLGKLAELLFIEAVRRYLASQPAEPCGWRAGISDPVIGRALAQLHQRMNERWTAEQLASCVGLSRSAFASRFTRIMGESPMRYLAQQRLQNAATRLATTADSIARIAFAVGYESEPAFNRAFKREFGLPPAAWRDHRLQAVSPAPSA